MVNRNLLRQFDLADEEMQSELDEAFRQEDIGGDINTWLPAEAQNFEVNKIVEGRVLGVVGDDVVVEWGKRDIFVAPSWHEIVHEASSELVDVVARGRRDGSFGQRLPGVTVEAQALKEGEVLRHAEVEIVERAEVTAGDDALTVYDLPR